MTGNGIPFARTKAFAKILNAVEVDIPSASQIEAICDALGMSTSTAFNIFANAFVRAKGMPFPVTVQEPATAVSRDKMLADTDQMLSEFSADYKRMAE